LGWINGLFMLVLGLSVLGLAGFALINIVSNSISASGDNLAWQNSASVREQQRQRVIDLQERRLNDLIEENKKRLLEIGELEGQIQEINTNISSLRELARQLQELLNGAVVGSSSSGQIPLVPNPTVKGQGTDSSKYIPPIRLPGGYIEPAQGQQYLNQFTSLLNRLDGVSQLLNNRKQNLTDNTLQLGNYQQEIMQQRAQLDAASANLSQLSRLGDGDAAPDVMPWPGQISSTYGWRMSPFRAGVREYHYGLDIEASEGTPVQVTKAGIVTYFGYDPGYGNMIEVTHAGGWLTRYAHNSKIVAKLGQTVRKGDIIALSGNTGASTGPHIHYEIHRNGVPVNPANFIPSLKGRY
jgi:murein DD-endopeptidase MepM/ murein hydrolase activator NlpD